MIESSTGRLRTTTNSQGRVLQALGAIMAASSIRCRCSGCTGSPALKRRTLRRARISSVPFMVSASFMVQEWIISSA